MKVNDAEKAIVEEVMQILDGAMQKLEGITDNKSIALVAKLIHAAVIAAEVLL